MKKDTAAATKAAAAAAKKAAAAAKRPRKDTYDSDAESLGSGSVGAPPLIGAKEKEHLFSRVEKAAAEKAVDIPPLAGEEEDEETNVPIEAICEKTQLS